MKIAITGKGGVGKTTIAGFLIKLLSKDYHVLAIDADSNPNLAYTLGFPEPEKIIPVVEMKSLIEERMETKLDSVGTYFKLNPKVDDIPEKYSVKLENIKLIVMGSIKKGGKGCACPENTFVKSLISHLILKKNEVVVMDMEAGLEHLGRGTTSSVDLLIIVTEPSVVSINTAEKIYELANDLKVKRIYLIANKIRKEHDIKFIENEWRKRNLDKNVKIIGAISFEENIIDNSISGKAIDIPEKILPELLKTVFILKQ